MPSSWSVSPDNKVVTFTLREDAEFSDGEPVTAAAAKKSIEYWVGKKGPFSTNLATLTSIDVVDDHTFKITLSSGNPNVLSLFDAYWLSGDLISPKAIDAGANLGAQTYGAGPYMLDAASTIASKSYVYVPNPYYYDKSKIYWDKVVIGVFEDQNSAIQAMKTGQLKVLVSDPLTGHANEANLPANIHIVSDPVQWLGLFLSDRDGVVNPALKDIRVRQALNFGIDRALVTKALFGKLGDPTDQLQGRGFVGHDDTIEAKYPYDPAKAKALLSEAGYGNGLELKVAYVHNTLSSVFFQAMAGQYRKIGVTLKGVELQNLGAIAPGAAQKQFELADREHQLRRSLSRQIPGARPQGQLQQLQLCRPQADATHRRCFRASRRQIGGAWKAVYAYVADIAWFVPVSATHVVYFVTSDVDAPNRALRP